MKKQEKSGYKSIISRLKTETKKQIIKIILLLSLSVVGPYHVNGLNNSLGMWIMREQKVLVVTPPAKEEEMMPEGNIVEQIIAFPARISDNCLVIPEYLSCDRYKTIAIFGMKRLNTVDICNGMHGVARGRIDRDNRLDILYLDADIMQLFLLDTELGGQLRYQVLFVHIERLSLGSPYRSLPQFSLEDAVTVIQMIDSHRELLARLFKLMSSLLFVGVPRKKNRK
jgi:hypothetical protein